MTQKNEEHGDRIAATAEIVSSYLLNHKTDIGEIEELIERVYGKLASLGGSVAATAPAQKQSLPAGVDVDSSITPDYIVCLEDGKKLKMLKRYLKTNFDMTPEEYRKRWSLPSTYPMVAPNYAKKRSKLAKEIGLGRKSTRATAKSAKKPGETEARQPKALAKPKGELPKGGKLKVVKSTDMMKAHGH